MERYRIYSFNALEIHILNHKNKRYYNQAEREHFQDIHIPNSDRVNNSALVFKRFLTIEAVFYVAKIILWSLILLIITYKGSPVMDFMVFVQSLPVIVMVSGQRKEGKFSKLITHQTLTKLDTKIVFINKFGVIIIYSEYEIFNK